MKLDVLTQKKAFKVIGSTVQFAVTNMYGGDNEDSAQICSLLAGYFAVKAKTDREQKQANSEDVAMQTQENSPPNPSEQQTKD